jgi:hypothetical protein
MKRAIAFIAAVLLLFSAIQLPAYASVNKKQGDVMVSVDKVIADAGADTIVSVNISGQYDANVLHLFVDYDSDFLQLNGDLTPGAVWSAIEGNNGYVSVNTDEAGRIGFIALLPQGTFGGNGTVFSMTFHVSADAAAGTVIPLNITVEQFSCDELDGTSNAVQFTAENGSITVPFPHSMEASISVNNAEAEPGAEAEIEIAVTGDYQANILNFTVEYDANIISLINDPAAGAIWNAITENGGYVFTNAAEEGKVGFIGLLPEGSIEGDGDIFSLTFRVADDTEVGTVIPITITVLQFSCDEIDGESNDVDCTVENGSVTVVAPAIETHTITYTVNGEEYATQTYEVGAVVTAPEYEVPEGYTFSGWDIPTVMPACDLTLNASLTGNPHTLTIEYCFIDDTPAAETFVSTVGFEENYSVNSPEVTGCIPDALIVTGTMPDEDVTVRVTYYRIGDTNLDNKVTPDDVSLLSAYLMNSGTLAGHGLANADANLDGVVDVLDLAAICSIAMGGAGK